MTGGIIQLVAYGQEDMFLSKNPQITFFKIVYRRHTNFSNEQIPQYFPDQQVNFGNKISASITKSGDLMSDIIVAITLPKIKKFQDTQTKFAWVRRIGFAMIKSVEIEINGRVIDKHYGEWLSIWSELSGDMHGDKSYGFNKMIGNVPEMTDFTDSKEEYKLYIPLKFWFCRSSGLALPLVALQYSDVKINIEFNNAEKCYAITPTHYIICNADLVNFLPYEYIEQKLSDGDVRAGIFSNYDIITKRLYYYKITNDKLTGIPISSGKNISDPVVVQSILSDTQNQKYLIYGKTASFSIFPGFNESSKTYMFSKIRNLDIVNCHLLINYIFLDMDERHQFLQSKHDYLIEQLYYTPNISLESINRSVKLTIDQPCKLLVWTTQMKYINDAGDHFNYTDSYQRKYDNSEFKDLAKGEVVGNNIITNETLLLNGRERVTMRYSDYFSIVQTHQHFKHSCTTGINMYSFGLHPLLTQPAGTCNMSQIYTIEVKLQLSHTVNINTPAIFRGYALCNNVLRISNGLCGVIFTK
jgi:hypothetical protein